MRCNQGQEGQLAISKQQLKQMRSSVACVSDRGTRPYHTAIDMMRLQTQRLIMKGVAPREAHACVARQDGKRDPATGTFGK